MKSRRAAQRRPPKRPLSARCPKILFMLVIMQFGVLSYMMFATPATGVAPGSEPQAQQVEELRREKQRLEATNTKLAAQVSAEDTELKKEREKLQQALDSIGSLRASARRSRPDSAGADKGVGAAGAAVAAGAPGGAKLSVGSGSRLLHLTLPGEGQPKRVP